MNFTENCYLLAVLYNSGALLQLNTSAEKSLKTINFLQLITF